MRSKFFLLFRRFSLQIILIEIYDDSVAFRGVGTGMFAIGGLIGSAIAKFMSENFGRRNSMIMINVSFLIGAVLLSTSTTSAQFAIGRIFVGIGSGFSTVVVSVYIAEIAPPKNRGALGTMLQLFTTIGIFVIQAIGLGLSSPIGWRVVTVITVVPAIIQMVALPFCAKSPRWLISQNRIEEAQVELLRLRHGDIEAEFQDMVSSAQKKKIGEKEAAIAGTTPATADTDSAVADETTPTPYESEIALTVPELLRIPVFLKLTIIMMIMHAGSQLSGINAIMYYSTTIFQMSFGDNAKYVSVGVGALNVVLTVVSLLVIDRLGRKVLLIISEFGMCIFCVIMTISVVFSVAPLQIVCIMLFVCCFAIGLGVIPFIYTAEAYPTYAVGAATSLALVVNWFFNFIIGLIYPTLQAACGGYVFLIFAGIGLLHGIFTIFFIRETKGKSIETIGQEMGWIDINPREAKAVASKNSLSEKA